jgi:hypothetical protein
MSETERDWNAFDPEVRTDGREIGREMVSKSVGLGSVMAHFYRGGDERPHDVANPVR